MSDPKKILRFPGMAGTSPPSDATSPDTSLPEGVPEAVRQAFAALSEDQRKALSLVGSGLSFVLVALRPTERGADFFTAVHGDATALRNAQPHLPGVIERAFARKGMLR